MRTRATAAVLTLALALTVGCAPLQPPNDAAILKSPFFLRLALHCYGDHVVKDCYSPPNIQPPVHCARQSDDTLICDVKSDDRLIYARCVSFTLGCEEIPAPAK